jgi:DHA1 family tetracycline resistance protein-like MFS transporter
MSLFSPGLSGPRMSRAKATPTAIRQLSVQDIPPLYLDASNTRDRDKSKQWQHLYVLPVLLFEFLALSLTRAVLPALLLQKYGNRVYLVMGCADCVRGLLAFLTCPLFGKVSDIVGRRLCLFVTVLGTCAPVCSLAFFSWESLSNEFSDETHVDFGGAASESVVEPEEASDAWSPMMSLSSPTGNDTLHPHAITVFVVLLAISGLFSSTFTLVFAYISDTVRQQEERVSAYGLALATFGLSFTIGPMAGGYLAKSNCQYVFLCSLLLTILDLLYIYFVLPESHQVAIENMDSNKSAISLVTLDHNFSWNPWDTLKLVVIDPFLRKVGQVAFLYYTGLWALISTLSVYAVQRFHLSPERLGELMSALGLCTMIAEAVLVRIMVPMLGEKQSVKIGLIGFALQCVVLGFAYEPWHLFVCAAFSLLGNLVYPSLSSLVSGSVEPDAVGEALGAVNGIKALTEGIGPLVFGTLMTLSEHSILPGWPYLLAAVLAIAAYKQASELPDTEDDDYIHELDRRKQNRDTDGIMMRTFIGEQGQQDEDEVEGLLSEIDESEDEDHQGEITEDTSRLPATFASLMRGSSTPKQDDV